MFKICWKMLATGVTGNGQPIYKTRAAAQDVCNVLNSQHAGEIHHWVA